MIVKNIHLAGLMFAGSVAMSAAAIAIAAPAPAGRGAAAPPPLEVLEFKPFFDDLMTMLVQPRHVKLYLAGKAQNWTLAAFELNELRGALVRIGQTIPKYQNFSVDATVGSIFQPKIQAMAAAITSQNPMRFDAAYRELTDACNVCHGGMSHEFLVIKVPDAAAAAAYADQDFRPQTAAK